jgi:hypothetical protein
MPSSTPILERVGRLAKGQVRGVRSQFFAGNRFNLTAFTESTVWNGPTDEYIFTDYLTDRITHISSDSALDVGSVVIIGLDENWNEVVQTVVLDGQNKVSLTTELIRINLVQSLIDLDGNVYVYEDGSITEGIPDNLGLVRGYVSYEDNISQMAVYSVPNSFIFTFESAVYISAPSAQCCLIVKNMVKFFEGATTTGFKFPLKSESTTAFQVILKAVATYSEKNDLYVSATPTTPGASISVVSEGELTKAL